MAKNTETKSPTPDFKALILDMEKAKQAVSHAEEAIKNAVESQETGAHFLVDTIPYQVVMRGGKKELECMMSPRARAIQLGLPVPPLVQRQRKTAAATAAANAENS